jgi:hypothetical protein
MELDNSIQIPPEKLQRQPFDVIIAVSGCESRCTYLTDKFDVAHIPTKIAFAFNEKNGILSQKQNCQKFHDQGFNFFHASSNDVGYLRELLDKICIFQPKDSLSVLVDYTEMPSTWINEIINYFLQLEKRLVSTMVWFSYSPSSYTQVQLPVSRTHNEIATPPIKLDKPVTLVLGLGCEQERAEEILQHLDAHTCFLFYADPAVDYHFVNDVLENNKALLKAINETNQLKYPLYDLNFINNSLTDICLNSRIENQLILAPTGPKPFALICYILAARYPDIKIWETKAPDECAQFDQSAHGELLLYKLEFTSEEVDYSD